MHFPKIKRPDWLEESCVEKTYKYYREGLYPESIKAWMLVVAMRHDLRAIYGSDLRAAYALVWEAIASKLAIPWYIVRSKIGLLTKLEREINEDLDEMEAEHQKTKQ